MRRPPQRRSNILLPLSIPLPRCRQKDPPDREPEGFIVDRHDGINSLQVQTNPPALRRESNLELCERGPFLVEDMFLFEQRIL